MFRIGEFSKMSKTTIKTLRYYDEVGLLKPQQIDKFTGYRFYSSSQLVLLHKIQSYRQIGLSINEILLIMSGNNEKEILERRKSKILFELAEQKANLSRINFILSGEEEKSIMNYQVTIKETPECIVYSTRFILPNYSEYFNIIPKIGEKVMKKYPDLKCFTPEYCFNIYLDQEYRETDINIEFCEAVTEMKEDFDDIHFKKMKSVTVASIFHKGAYETLSTSYAFIYKWIEENNYIVAGGARESYIDGIWNKENSNDWLTEIQVPIAKKTEIEDKYGNTKEFAETKSKDYTKEENNEITKIGNEILKKFAAIKNEEPTSDNAQKLVKEWQDYITKYHYKCSNEILASLGEMYVLDERFKENIDRFGIETAIFMSKAIKFYCK